MMELAIYAVLTAIWWMSSATFLLPFLFLLKYSNTFSNMWFAFLYGRCILPIFGSRVVPYRKKAFEMLKESLSSQNASNALKVLEIGIGSGANFQFYPENSHLTALDMNESFDPLLRLSEKKNQHIVHDRKVIAFAEDMKEVDDCSMDVVICTYVLCFVNSINDVLKEVKRVLRPGGKFIFMEHVDYPRSQWSYLLQQFAKPLWKIYGGGCCLGRSTENYIKNAGFSNVNSKKVFPDSLVFFVRPHIYGIATK